MFANDDLIFIQLQKTGCTHIANLIHQRWPGAFSTDGVRGKHQPLVEATGGKAVLGSIRNPYSWYVSLWAYGCQQKGTLAWDLTASAGRIFRTQVKQTLRKRQTLAGAATAIGRHASKDPGFWRRVYSDSDNVEHFREWLHAIHAADEGKVMTEGYADWGCRMVAGFYTYRFLYLFTAQDAWQAAFGRQGDYAQLRAFYEANGIVDHFVRTECIDEDLSRAMSAITAETVSFGEDKGKKTNYSKHRPTEDYYDAVARALIRDRDRLIFETFYPEDLAEGGAAAQPWRAEG